MKKYIITEQQLKELHLNTEDYHEGLAVYNDIEVDPNPFGNTKGRSGTSILEAFAPQSEVDMPLKDNLDEITKDFINKKFVIGDTEVKIQGVSYDGRELLTFWVNSNDYLERDESFSDLLEPYGFPDASFTESGVMEPGKLKIALWGW